MKVSGAPDPRFNGRDVYMMAIQMPNLTSYSGQLADVVRGSHGARSGAGADAPPVAHRKVDPKYIATAAAEERSRAGATGLRDRKGRAKFRPSNWCADSTNV